jgi:hypothetical protein
MNSAGEPMYDMIVALYQKAILDAQSGDPKAIEWLEVVAPDWRKNARSRASAKA